MTPEVAIVGTEPARQALVDAVRDCGYGVREFPGDVLAGGGSQTELAAALGRVGAVVLCLRGIRAAPALAKLRRDRHGASVPVILYGNTGSGIEDLADLIDLGADHFISEPLRPSELEDALHQLVGAPDTDDLGPVARETTETLGDDFALDASDEPRSRDLHQPADFHPGAEDHGQDHYAREASAAPGASTGEARPDPSVRAAPSADEEGRDPGDSGGWPFDFGTSPGGEYEAAGGRNSRGEVLGKLRKTLDKVDAKYNESLDDLDRELREADDRELAELGLEAIPDVEPEGETIEPDESASKMRLPGPVDDAGSDSSDGYPSIVSALPRAAATYPLERDEVADSPVSPTDSDAQRIALRRRVEAEDALALTAKIEALDTGHGGGRHESNESALTESVPPQAPLGPEPGSLAGRVVGEARTGVESPESLPSQSAPGSHDDALEAPTPFSKTEVVRETPAGADEAPGFESRAIDASVLYSDDDGTGFEPAATVTATAEPSAFSSVAALATPTENSRPLDRMVVPRVPQGGLRAEQIHPSAGRLDEQELPRIFEWLHRRSWSGDLVVARPGMQKLIQWVDGAPVRCDSSAARDGLCDVLVRRGLLTRRQYAELGRLGGPERATLAALAHAGWIKVRELPRLHALWVRTVVEECFGWSAGGWRLIEVGDRVAEFDGERQRCAAILAEFDTLRLIFEATRNSVGHDTARARLAAFRPRPQRTVAAQADPQAWALRLALDADEERWLRTAAGPGRHDDHETTIESPGDPEAWYVFVYALQVIGLFELPWLTRVDDASDPVEVDRQRIFERLRLARAADYFEFLGLPLDASSADVRGAYHDLWANFADVALEKETRRQCREELAELRAALERARDLLLDESTRCAYLRQMSRAWASDGSSTPSRDENKK